MGFLQYASVFYLAWVGCLVEFSGNFILRILLKEWLGENLFVLSKGFEKFQKIGQENEFKLFAIEIFDRFEQDFVVKYPLKSRNENEVKNSLKLISFKCEVSLFLGHFALWKVGKFCRYLTMQKIQMSQRYLELKFVKETEEIESPSVPEEVLRLQNQIIVLLNSSENTEDYEETLNIFKAHMQRFLYRFTLPNTPLTSLNTTEPLKNTCQAPNPIMEPITESPDDTFFVIEGQGEEKAADPQPFDYFFIKNSESQKYLMEELSLKLKIPKKTHKIPPVPIHPTPQTFSLFTELVKSEKLNNSNLN